MRFDRQLQRRQRLAFIENNPAAQTARHVRPGDLQYLLITFCCDESDAGAATGKHRIRRHGRAVHDVTDLLRFYACLMADFLDAVEHTNGRILRRRRDFGGIKRSRTLIDQQ